MFFGDDYSNDDFAMNAAVETQNFASLRDGVFATNVYFNPK